MAKLNRAPKVFVGAVFVILGLSFWLSTALLIIEFRDADWPTLLVAHSHLFFFFPVFGCLALAAFFIPSVVFTDFYWYELSKTKHGRTRFAVGTVVVLIAALAFAIFYAGAERRAVWEIPPSYLLSEKAQTTAVPSCTDANGKPCYRQPVLASLQALRAAARERWSIAEFSRACKPDPYLEGPATSAALRHCFPAGTKLTAGACCLVQSELQKSVFDLVIGKQQRSELSKREEVLTFTKCFFVLVIMVIGLMLLFWQKRISKAYSELVPAIERGIIVGAVAMTYWLLMDYGYQQTSDVLFGRDNTGATFRISLSIILWAVLVVLYFARRSMMRMSTLSRYGTLAAPVASGLATWWSYDAISNITAKLFGSGAEYWMFGGLLGLAVVGIGLVYGPFKLQLPAVKRLVDEAVPPGAGGTGPSGVPPPGVPLLAGGADPAGVYNAIYIVTPSEVEKARQPRG